MDTSSAPLSDTTIDLLTGQQKASHLMMSRGEWERIGLNTLENFKHAFESFLFFSPLRHNIRTFNGQNYLVDEHSGNLARSTDSTYGTTYDEGVNDKVRCIQILNSDVTPAQLSRKQWDGILLTQKGDLLLQHHEFWLISGHPHRCEITHVSQLSREAFCLLMSKVFVSRSGGQEWAAQTNWNRFLTALYSLAKQNLEERRNGLPRAELVYYELRALRDRITEEVGFKL